MYKHKCSLCGEVFESENKTITQKIKKHLGEKHNIDFQTYITKTFFNGVEPKCACGCGKPVKFNPKDALWNEQHGYNKYYNCGHVGSTRKGVLTNVKYVENWSDKDWVTEYYKINFGIDVLQESAIKFINGSSALELSKEYNIDVRTLRGAWVKLGLITAKDMKSLSEKRKSEAALKRKKTFDNKEEVLADLYNIIKFNPQKFNIRSLIRHYNRITPSKVEVDCDIVFDALREMYGNEVVDLIQFGAHSKEELEFLDVLLFYFNKKIVRCGYCLYTGKTKSKRDCYIYDFCVGGKILIEYDGEGYWHSDEETIKKDKEKEIFAIKNGYKIIRVSLKETKNPEFILKLKKMLEND